MTSRCDCLNRCGDDSRVAAGKVAACAHWSAWKARARIVGVQRDADDAHARVVIYDRPPDEDDLRDLQRHDRQPFP